MAKTNEEFQQELAQLFVRAGEAQFMSRALKKMIEDENNKLNNLNQQIEKLQKDYRTALSTGAVKPMSIVPPQQAEVANVPEASPQDLPVEPAAS